MNYLLGYATNDTVLSYRKKVITVGIVVIDVCDGNTITTLDIEGIIETEFPEAAVVISECLLHCGLCRVRPYALVNGKKVYGKTPEECLDKIRAAIKEELAVYY